MSTRPDPTLATTAARATVIRAVRAGSTYEQAAAKVGASADAISDRAATDPEFRRSIDEAWADGEEWRRAKAESARADEDRQRDTIAAKPVPTIDDGASGALDLETIERHALSLAGPLPLAFGFLLYVDAACVRAGMPALSPWWRWSLGEAYASLKQWLIFLVGRGGGKSTSLERVAGSDAVWSPRKVPPGQVWTWPFISVGPDDANRRVNGIAAVFRAMGMAVIGDDNGEGKRVKEGVKMTRAPRGSLELVDARGNPIQLASIAGTIGNVSGPSTIGMTIDEAAKLHDKGTNANPLTEIIASGAQTSRARPGWRAIVCSSAWEPGGAHHQLVTAGDNDTNHVARIGATFIDDAKRGLEAVAAWEQGRGNAKAAAAIRAHANALTALSPMVPTWVANNTIGNPDGAPWDAASGALATRRMVEALPEGALDGLAREAFWLRENASVPLDRTGAGGVVYAAEDFAALASFNREPPQRNDRHGMRRDGLLHVHGYDEYGRATDAQAMRRRGL